MKFKLTLKDPDGVSNSIEEAVERSVDASLINDNSIDDEEKEQITWLRKQKIQDAIKPWVRYNEYVTIEIDTEKGTAVVCSV